MGRTTARLCDRRIRLMLAATIVAFGVVLLRASYLQAVEGPRLGALAAGQQQVVRTLTAPRGRLLDRQGTPLASNEQAVTIGAYTRLVRDPGALATRLAPLLGLNRTALRAALSSHAAHVDVKRQVDPTVAERIRRNGIGTGALTFATEQRRVYPQGNVGSQVVGFANIDGVGIAGAEGQFEPYLRPRPGSETLVGDPAKQEVLRVLSRRPAIPGRDVRLTLDSDIQAQVEQVMAQAQARYKAKSATAVVIDTRTGGILALASAPGVPTTGYSTATNEQRRIRAISDQFEPGSTFKVVTIGAGLETGKLTAETAFSIPYCISRYDRTVCDAHPHPTKTMTVSDILEQSSNVGAITLAWHVLHQSLFDQWTHRLGFGKRSHVDLPGEEPGRVLPFQDWSGTSILNIPIGEGIAVTPLQMASLYAAIANRGVWRRPHVLDRVAGQRAPAGVSKRLFSRETAAELTAMLEKVVTGVDGTGTEARIPGYSVAGKTGTTQKIDPRTHSYCGSPGARCEYDASFVGFVPAKKPRAVVMVLVDEPHGQYYGGVVAAPAFREIAANVLHVLGLAPDVPETPLAGR